MVFVERVCWASRCKDQGVPLVVLAGDRGRRSAAIQRARATQHYFAKPS